MKYEIKKGIPMPPKRGGSALRDLMAQMEIGDCIDVDATQKSNTTWYASKVGIKVATRSVEENGQKLTRVWRIE